MSNLIRSRNRLPFDFQDGLKVAGVDISQLIAQLIEISPSRVILNNTNIVNGLGYTPVNKAGDTMSGSLTINGNLIATGDVTAYSDEKLKNDWKNLPDDFLLKLSNVKSGTYNRIDTNTRQAGVSAQSLKEVLPECVVGNDTLSVSYGPAALVSTIALAKKCIDLENRLIQSNSNMDILLDMVKDMHVRLNAISD